MEKVKTIKGSNCVRYSNLLHCNFHTRIWQMLRELEDKTKVGLSDEVLTEYGTNIAAETDANREPRAHINTEALHEADVLRDKATSYVFNLIEAAKDATIPDVVTAGKALSIVIAPYKGIQSEADDAETAGITGCVQDLRKTANNGYVVTLNLGAAITAADEANKEFERLQKERTESKKADKKESAKTIRLRTDDNYNRICELIYASQLLCAVPADKEIILDVIDSINAIVDEFKLSYNRSQGQKKAGKNKPSGGNKPAEDNQPGGEDEGSTEPGDEDEGGTEPGGEPEEGNEPEGGDEPEPEPEPEPDDRPVVQ